MIDLTKECHHISGIGSTLVTHSGVISEDEPIFVIACSVCGKFTPVCATIDEAKELARRGWWADYDEGRFVEYNEDYATHS